MKTQASLFEKTLETARLRWSDFVFVGIFVVLILISSLVSETFFTSRNLINISRQIVTNGLISLGMLVVILTGGVDLSVGSTVALCGIMAT
ncbi:MAG TPA: ribose ABC transporter permease, partial [Spirochaetia bacterium]|nr:ribose ABC transporter permease [Spirochaetia bacterium]